MTQHDAIALLREELPQGSTVYGIVRHVAASGMSRHISLLHFRANSDGTVRVRDWTRAASAALGWRLNKRGNAMVVSGCGMDMVFHTIYELSATLHGNGYALKNEAI